MNRLDAIREHQARRGKVLAVLPIHYPKELLTALDILAVELWGPPGPPRGPDAGRMQSYVCAIVRNALAFISAGGAAPADGLLFPHTCDSIQGLATVVRDFGAWPKPVFHYIHARGEERPSARRFVEAELERLAGELAAFAGRPLDEARLRDGIRLHRAIDRLRATLLDRRAHLPLGDRELYRLLRRGEYLWPEDHLAELEAAAAGLAPAPVQQGVPVLVSGIVPEPMSVLDALAGAGAFVAADDYAAVGRRVNRHQPGSLDDPFAALAELAFAAPACSTRQSNQVARADRLEALLESSGALGVLLHGVKFCEPELFDLPVLRRRLLERGVPVLQLETELELELSGQALTRIEAFVEMLGAAAGRGAG
jgi:benzoyl-CoA reductase/2-hydroxyglutaryl-CoA dehydratase subunit BcrC/BadD/HgdB